MIKHFSSFQISFALSNADKGPIPIHLDNCYEVDKYNVTTKDGQSLCKRIFDCSDDPHNMGMFEQTSDGLQYISTLTVVVTRKNELPRVTQQSELLRPISSGELDYINQNTVQPVSEINSKPAPAPAFNLTSQFNALNDSSPLPSQKLLPFGLTSGSLTSIFSNTAFTNTIASTSSCTIIGKFATASCTTYNHCYGFGRGQLGITCPTDFAFDAHYKHCSLNWSTCPLLARCTTNGQLIADPTDQTRFFICILNQRSLFATTYEKQYSVFRRSCPAGQRFVVANQGCVAGGG